MNDFLLPVAVTITAGGMAILVAATVGLVGCLLVALAYNRLVRCRNHVREGFSGIDVQLKRRHELVPQLVACVQGYRDFERSLLEDLTKARGATDDMSRLNAEESQLTGSLRSFFALAEAYPDLKAGANFRQLSEQLVAVEDALQYARRYYNGAVRDLNVAVESFPSNLVADWFGFKPEAFFEVESVTERAAPQVNLAGSPADRKERER